MPRLSQRPTAAFVRLLLVALLILGPLLVTETQPAQAARVKRDAILTSITRNGSSGRATLTLDYVEIRDCTAVDCDTDFEIVNTNPAVRRFTMSASTRILLLKDASGETFRASLTQLIDARKGKNLGWTLSKDDPMNFTVDENTRVMTEIRQLYFP